MILILLANKIDKIRRINKVRIGLIYFHSLNTIQEVDPEVHTGGGLVIYILYKVETAFPFQVTLHTLKYI